MAENFIQKIGYTEMYEWENIPEERYSLFVQFSKTDPNKIEPFHDKDGMLLGVSTVSSLSVSDDPSYWNKAYLCDKNGDMLLQKEKLAVGIKQYDQHEEFSFISTQPWEHYINIPNEKYDEERKYTKRSLRAEWTKVNLCGKVIVKDNGSCKPGEYCTPYIGSKKKLAGSAIPWEANSQYKFYVMERISDTTILIVNKNMA